MKRRFAQYNKLSSSLIKKLFSALNLSLNVVLSSLVNMPSQAGIAMAVGKYALPEIIKKLLLSSAENKTIYFLYKILS
jgi:hypothetical protein